MKGGVGIDELCGFRLTPLPRSIVFPDPNPPEDDAKFFGFSKRAEGGPSRAGRRSKTFLEVPMEFRVSSGNPESRLSIPLGVGTVNKVDWERGALKNCSLSQDRKILVSVKEFTLFCKS